MSRMIPTQQRSRATQRKIAEAAHVVIEREGRDRFTMKQVIEEAGMSDGIIYRYWADRGDLIADLYPTAIEGLGPMRKFDDA